MRPGLWVLLLVAGVLLVAVPLATSGTGNVGGAAAYLVLLGAVMAVVGLVGLVIALVRRPRVRARS